MCVWGKHGRGSGKSHHYLRGAIVFKKLRFQNDLRPHENAKLRIHVPPVWENVFKKLRFQNDLRPHENAKLRIHVPPVWESVFKKLRFRVGLVRTVGLTVEIKLRFRIFPRKGGNCCNCKYSSTEDGKCFRNMFVKFQSRLISDLKHLAFVIELSL